MRGLSPLIKLLNMLKILKKEMNFPAVPIKKISDNLYSLIWVGENGDGLGGHKRAIAHYISNKPLKCIFVQKGLTVPETDKIFIEDIILDI